MPPMISIAAVTKRYKSGLVALHAIDLEIARGEIFALLGPNGAGKTTLIGVVCGSVSMTSGQVFIDGHDVVRDYRAARSIVGLVPQEIALDSINLEIARGEIFALLGPNGAGKTTLIGVVCGSVSMTSGQVLIDGHDVVRDYRAARSIVGLVPQEIALDIFTTVRRAATFSRGLFGRTPNPAYIEQLLRDLSLWDKRDTRIVELSGGMKRRVMIAKALAHEPDVLFLDEPTAGVDVNLRRDMWALVRRLRSQGVTVILTTHYIEEAEEMADRVGVINNGRIVLVEEKAALMRKLGKRRLTLALQKPLRTLPTELAGWPLELEEDGRRLSYRFSAGAEDTGVPTLLRRLNEIGIDFKDLDTSTTTLEDIFVDLVGRAA
jgi:ABC-2 type transport system ATP-binding protein